MALIQQQAKSLAAKKISSSQFNYDRDVDKYTTQNQNNANSRFDQLYEKQLKDSRFTAQQSTQIQDRRRDENYAREQANDNADRTERANVRASQPISAGSYSESFGVGAAMPNFNTTNVYGQKGLYNSSAAADWRMRQDGVLNDMYLVEKRSSDLDRDKQSYLASVNTNNQARLMGQQAALDSQKASNDRMYQGGQADKDRANQRYLAEIDSRTRLQQSIFNGNGNGFQYWGGSI